MITSEGLGKRIRTEREKQSLSRENLCRNGANLTVRQLLRIEKGESIPSLDKLDYIARNLNVKVADLLEADSIDIPEDYFRMKSRLIKFPTYGEKDRVEQKQELIEEAYEKYFSVLPEEELLFLDLSENLLEWTQTGKIPHVEEMFEDAFEQAQKKKALNLNDLLVLGYYLVSIQRQKYYDQKLFAKIERRLLKQEATTDELINIELLSTLMDLIGVRMLHDDYKGMLPIIKQVHLLINTIQQPTYKPSILMIEAKYYLHAESDREKAEELYEQAISLASILGDPALSEGLQQEKSEDGL
ncbi:helix-turn-helix domain-containing protein [Streptococcus dentapri]|uniref:Helix-turn-helix domain-containing protein n=1 Tax=Streptococcus dentapri TaxID=573564 RepID=A0ABV8D3U8_9STRE